MKIDPLRGTRDFYPETKLALNTLILSWREVAEQFGYQDFDGPLLEPAELWKLKSGGEIPEQMYVFTDKGNREVAIRPELTPTLARMIAAKQKELSKPIRWYTIGRCWRYEAPQSGRLREFFQFNVDLLGTESMQADAEVIVTAIEVMKRFGCTPEDFYVRVSNRKLIQALLLKAGVTEEQLTQVSRVIDKKDKLSRKEFVLALKELKLRDKVVQNIIDTLELKDVKNIKKEELGAIGQEGLRELQELFTALEAYAAAAYVEFDPSLMRGFDYYTSTVFEVFDRRKEFRAIAGGGRYGDLVSDFEGERCPGIGYGMGDVVLELFLRKIGKFPERERGLDYYVAALTENEQTAAIRLAQRLRSEGKSVELDVAGRKVGKQARYAANIGAKRLVIVGSQEIQSGKAKAKDLKSGEETELPL